MKEKVLKNVIRRMSVFLDEKQMKELEICLVKEFDSVEFANCSTQIATCDDFSNEKMLLEQFKSTMLLRGLSDSTVNQYVSATRNMLISISKPIEKITSLDIKGYLADYQTNHRISKVTLNNMIRYINSFFNWLEFEDFLEKNPMRKIKSVKQELILRESLSDKEIEILKCNCKTERETALVEFLATTGVRLDEVGKLDISDIKDRTCIVFGKGSKERKVYISESAMVHLERYISSRKGNNQALFTSEKFPYGRLSNGGIYNIISNIGKRCGIDVYPHKIRHTMISVALNRGMPLQEVSFIAGHKDINTTMRYWTGNSELIKVHHSQFCY